MKYLTPQTPSWADLKQQDDREISQAKALKDLQGAVDLVLKNKNSLGDVEFTEGGRNILKAGLALYRQSNPAHAAMLEKGLKKCLSGYSSQLETGEQQALKTLLASKGNITKETLVTLLSGKDTMFQVGSDLLGAAVETYGKTNPTQAALLKKAGTGFLWRKDTLRALSALVESDGNVTRQTLEKVFGAGSPSSAETPFHVAYIENPLGNAVLDAYGKTNPEHAALLKQEFNKLKKDFEQGWKSIPQSTLDKDYDKRTEAEQNKIDAVSKQNDEAEKAFRAIINPH